MTKSKKMTLAEEIALGWKPLPEDADETLVAEVAHLKATLPQITGKRGRKPLPAVIDAEPAPEQAAAFAGDFHAAQEVISEAESLKLAAHDRALQMAEKIGYELPANLPDADLIQRDIAANMRRSVESVLDIGRGLLVLKSLCGHGEFLTRLEALNMDARLSQRFMQSALKFSNAASTPLLNAAGSQTKLFELLVLDDEEIKELAETGQTGELALDDVATMSVKELRQALRDARADKEAAEQVSAENHKKLDAAEAAVKKLSKKSSDIELDTARAEGKRKGEALACRNLIRDQFHAAKGAIEEMARALTDYYTDFDPAEELAPGYHELAGSLYASLIEQANTADGALKKAMAESGIRDFEANPPAWMKEDYQPDMPLPRSPLDGTMSEEEAAAGFAKA
ncbi:MAG: DUF3102 domain-containing protein [Zoogloeaceae bacterium]|jgi:hypothetical protein|nr:DUF3102 domain-containing protein [Zoogloeaceae bacterium]